MEKIIIAIIGFVAGAVGSLIAPWVNWGIEQRKQRRASRNALINNARGYVTSKAFGVVRNKIDSHYSK
jgi:tetrahydromethanopterin S-methyltransferase subunit E